MADLFSQEHVDRMRCDRACAHPACILRRESAQYGEQYQPTQRVPPILVSMDPAAVYCRDCHRVWQPSDEDLCDHYWSVLDAMANRCSVPDHVYGCECGRG